MNRHVNSRYLRLLWPLLALIAWPVAGHTQVAVAEIEELEEFPTISATEIDELVGPIALYPDDLLAIVLPASTFPLQIVEAGRFLEDLENDSTLQPDEDWDDSIVALLNYPEVIELLNEDLDWTWRLGEAVVAQQSDVIAAIEGFRDRAYAAGNLKSDDYQLVSQDEGTIQITPVQDDVIYVPYYEPEQVVVYQPRPVYYYYPRAYPVYYYPYPSYYSFHDHFHHNYFWGVTTAFAIGWQSHHLNVFHHSFYGHPYYGHSYRDRYWYRRPDIHVYNTTYVRNNGNASYDRYRRGDNWTPRNRRTVRGSDQRITRTRYYPSEDSQLSVGSGTRSFSNTNRSGQVTRTTASSRSDREVRIQKERDQIKFRSRPSTPALNSQSRTTQRTAKLDSARSASPKIDRQRSPSQVVTVRSRPERTSIARPDSQPRSLKPSRSNSQSRSAAPSRAAPQRPSPPQSSASRQSKSGSSAARQSRSSASKPAPTRSAKASQSSNRSTQKSESRRRRNDR
jgi:hypothetical protein